MSGPVHFIAHISIDDADGDREYEEGFFPILKQHGGRFISYDDDVTVLEGERAEGRTVVIQFESESALLGWWNSPEYVELAKHRHLSTTAHSVIVVHAPPTA